MGHCTCSARKKKEKKALTPAQEAERQNKRNKKQIKAILKEAANTRKAFIEGILSGRIKKVTNEEKGCCRTFRADDELGDIHRS